MRGPGGWIRAIIVVGAGLALTACASAPRYSIYPTGAGGYPPPDLAPGVNPTPPPYEPPAPNEAPLPDTAPIAPIEGGALPPPAASANTTPNYPSTDYPAPAASASVSTSAGAAYVIQPGDTISGVGRRFRTPVQTLIDLNQLGPRGAISPGQRVLLPDSAIDMGGDPYATGPAPIGVLAPNGALPPPPPPPSGNPVLPPSRPPAQVIAAQPAPSAGASAAGMVWPVRGEVVRRFGPVGMGEKNNGINIGAEAGAAVVASQAGRVAYVGDDLVGQGLTVLVVHRNGWRTVYGHLGSATVDDGADVRQGQQIGTVGLTAGDGRPSMHFETRHMEGDDPVAVDPLTVLPR